MNPLCSISFIFKQGLYSCHRMKNRPTAGQQVRVTLCAPDTWNLLDLVDGHHVQSCEAKSLSLSWPRLLPFLQPANIEGRLFHFNCNTFLNLGDSVRGEGHTPVIFRWQTFRRTTPPPTKKPYSHLSAGVFPFLSKTKGGLQKPLAAPLSCNFPQLTLKKGVEKHAVPTEPLWTKSEDTVFPYLFWETSSSLNT